MMTRIQTQLYTRRLKTEKDKKVLKSQTKAVNKHSLDKAKVRCMRSFMIHAWFGAIVQAHV
jgi:hypothetical protein